MSVNVDDLQKLNELYVDLEKAQKQQQRALLELIVALEKYSEFCSNMVKESREAQK